MKLFSVEFYQEVYYKSIYKPIIYDPATTLHNTYRDDPMSFVSPLISESEIQATVWLDYQGNLAGLIREVTSLGDMMTVMEAEQWRSIMKVYFEKKELTEDFMRMAWNSLATIWRNCMARASAAQHARRFWETVRASSAWNGLYDNFVKQYLEKWPADVAKLLAEDSADYYTREFLKGRITAGHIIDIIHGGAEKTYIDQVLRWLTGFSLAMVIKIGLVGLAAVSVALLIFNPDERGTRTKRYLGSKLLMRYQERMFWCDLVAKSPEGRSIFYLGAELFAAITNIEHVGPTHPGQGERWEITPTAGQTEEKDWWYIISICDKMNVVYLGFLSNIGGFYYKLQEGYWRWEPKPVEVYEDQFGNIKAYTPRWWTEQPGMGALKPIEDWFDEGGVSWTYHVMEPLII